MSDLNTVLKGEPPPEMDSDPELPEAKAEGEGDAEEPAGRELEDAEEGTEKQEGEEAEEEPFDAKAAFEAMQKEVKAFKKLAEDERRKRQALEAGQSRGKRPEGEFLDNPDEHLAARDQELETRLFNERLNMSEMLARRAYDDLDDMVEVFRELADKDDAVRQAFVASRDPYDYAYKTAKAHKERQEMSEDPQTFREKLLAEAEERAYNRLKKEQAEHLSRKLPKSLEREPSAGGGRTGDTTFSGPTPLGRIVGPESRKRG